MNNPHVPNLMRQPVMLTQVSRPTGDWTSFTRAIWQGMGRSDEKISGVKVLLPEKTPHGRIRTGSRCEVGSRGLMAAKIPLALGTTVFVDSLPSLPSQE